MTGQEKGDLLIKVAVCKVWLYLKEFFYI